MILAYHLYLSSVWIFFLIRGKTNSFPELWYVFNIQQNKNQPQVFQSYLALNHWAKEHNTLWIKTFFWGLAESILLYVQTLKLHFTLWSLSYSHWEHYMSSLNIRKEEYKDKKICSTANTIWFHLCRNKYIFNVHIQKCLQWVFLVNRILEITSNVKFSFPFYKNVLHFFKLSTLIMHCLYK